MKRIISIYIGLRAGMRLGSISRKEGCTSQFCKMICVTEKNESLAGAGAGAGVGREK